MIMVYLIDKEALVAEIEKVADEPAPSHDQQCPWEDGYCCGLYKAEYIINTLKVKEVDLEKLIDDYMLPITSQDVKEEPFTQLEKCAKHFFELGMQQSKNDNTNENKN